MYIDPNKEIAGYSQVKIRDLLLKANREKEEWEISFITKNLNASQDEAIKLVKELEQEGLIEVSTGKKIWKRNPEKFQKEELTNWKLTDEGRRFSKASTECISRNEAQKRIDGLPKRIEQANQNPEFAYTISRAFVFGSYLETDKQYLGDVDIALEFEPKEKDPQKQQEREEVRKVLAKASGKVNSLLDFDSWPKNEICDFLQEGIGHMDIAMVADVLGENWKYRTLYP